MCIRDRYDCTIEACPVSDLNAAAGADVILLGPQEMCIRDRDGYEGYKKPVDEAAKHCVEKCDKRLRQVFSRTYLELRTRHIEDYRSVNKDTEFDLGEPEQAVPTDVPVSYTHLELFEPGRSTGICEFVFC